MKQNAIKILERFYSDPDNVIRFFGGVKEILEYVNKISPEVFDEIDASLEIWYENEEQDYILYNQLKNSDDKLEFIRRIISQHNLNDLKIDGDKIIYDADTSDMVNLFKGGRRGGDSQYVANLVLSGEYHEWVNHYEYSIEDIVELLNRKNLLLLKKVMIKNLNGVLSREEIEDNNIDLLSEILEIQGNPYFLEVDMENVSDMLDDKETLEFIFDNYLTDVRNELTSSYYNAYNQSFEDMVSEQVFSSIREMLGDFEVQDFSTKNNHKTIYGQNFLVDVTPNIVGIFMNYLSGYDDRWRGIDYYGSFVNIMNQWLDDGNRIDLDIPDYPDSDDVENYFNEELEI